MIEYNLICKKGGRGISRDYRVVSALIQIAIHIVTCHVMISNHILFYEEQIMKISKISLLCLLLSGVYCANALATDYCPSGAQISAGQLNGWVYYVSGSSGNQPATPAQLKQFEARKNHFGQAIWWSDTGYTGMQNAVCIYYPNGALSKTEPVPVPGASNNWSLLNPVEQYYSCTKGRETGCAYN